MANNIIDIALYLKQLQLQFYIFIIPFIALDESVVSIPPPVTDSFPLGSISTSTSPISALNYTAIELIDLLIILKIIPLI